MTKSRLWRVDFIHLRGYNAPHSLVETTEERECKAEAEAINMAKKSSRLSDFDCWELTVTNLRKKQLNGKWYTEEEYNSRIGR